MNASILSEIRTTPARTDDGDHDRFQHYFFKEDIDRNMFEGTPMTACCGKVVVKQVDPKGRTVCPACAEFMENIVGRNKPPGERGNAQQPL